VTTNPRKWDEPADAIPGRWGPRGYTPGRAKRPLGPRASVPARLLAALRHLTRRTWAGLAAASPIVPVAVVALVLVATAWIYYVRFDFAHQPWGVGHHAAAVPVWLAFNDLGSTWAARIGDQADAVAVSGYDGQYYFYLAQDPAVMSACAHGRAHGRAHCPIDASPLREQRILYPMTARLLTLGNLRGLHVALFVIDFAAILLSALLVGQLCVVAGASRWLGAAAAIYVGELQGLVRDLADPYAVFWVVLAVYFLRKDRPLRCAAAVAAALLTREQLVLALPLLVLPLLARRQWGTAALFLGIALGPFVAWQAILRAIFGYLGLQGSFATTDGVHLPFAGLWAQRFTSEFGDMIAFVAIPLVAAAIVALAWMRRHVMSPLAHEPSGLRLHALWTRLAGDPVPLVVLVSAVLATLTAAHEWEGTWASARLVAPFVVLAVVVACEVAAPLRRSYVALVAATAVATLMIPPLLY
jgi:hypothetical protein